MTIALRVRKVLAVLSVRSWRKAVMRQRVVAGAEHLAILKNLNDVRTVVDIGANRGQFALVARYCYPRARIISFEPLPRPAAVFEEVFGSDSNVQLIKSAVGSHSGVATVHVSARDDSSSLLPIGVLQEKLFPGTAETGTDTVRVVALEESLDVDDVEGSAVLKIDVQGYELEVLKGCEALLKSFSWVYAECSFVELYRGQALVDDVIGWLRNRGFLVDGVYNMSYDGDGRAIQADFLFRRRGT